MKKQVGSCITVILLIISIQSAHAAKEDSRELYYTYVGPVAGFGMNQITVNDWFGDRTKTKKVSGTYVDGGALFKIIVNRLAGDFTVQYMYNSDGSYSIQHMYYSSAARYIHNFTDTFALSPGIGLYFESHPASKKYNGSTGFYIPMGISYKINDDTKLITDLKMAMGSFGIGEGSGKISFGIEVGVIFKSGRL